MRRLRIRRVRNGCLRDYGGMNRLAAKELGFKMPRGVDVLIPGGMGKGEARKVIRHERIEMSLMGKGMRYWPAHVRALNSERKRR